VATGNPGGFKVHFDYTFAPKLTIPTSKGFDWLNPDSSSDGSITERQDIQLSAQPEA